MNQTVRSCIPNGHGVSFEFGGAKDDI